ncbi:MAG: coiled-coil domain-containing protein, partial [Nitrososphaeraceae archaeon]
ERAKIHRMREENSPRFEIALDTGFRKRFNTILKTNPNISYAIAERLMDHRTNLEQFYLDTPRDALFVEYKKAIIDLMIDDSERLRQKNRQLEDERSEFEKRALEIKQQKDELTGLKIEMEKVKMRLSRTRNLRQVRK